MFKHGPPVTVAIPISDPVLLSLFEVFAKFSHKIKQHTAKVGPKEAEEVEGEEVEVRASRKSE